jgi:hypothetical protein
MQCLWEDGARIPWMCHASDYENPQHFAARFHRSPDFHPHRNTDTHLANQESSGATGIAFPRPDYNVEALR